MSATVDTNTDWQDQAVALRRDQKMATAEIAERFGKSASQVRRVLSKANTDRAINGRDAEADAAEVEAIKADIERVAFEQGRAAWPGGVFPGQTTVDEHLANIDPGDDPEHPDTLAEFRAEAGEAVGPMPPDPNPPEPLGFDVRLAGSRQMALDFGPNADVPVGGTLVIKSDKLASGFYGLGDVVTGTFTARVVDVAGKERLQRASEEFRAQPQHHVALITELKVVVPGP